MWTIKSVQIGLFQLSLIGIVLINLQQLANANSNESDIIREINANPPGPAREPPKVETNLGSPIWQGQTFSYACSARLGQLTMLSIGMDSGYRYGKQYIKVYLDKTQRANQKNAVASLSDIMKDIKIEAREKRSELEGNFIYIRFSASINIDFYRAKFFCYAGDFDEFLSSKTDFDSFLVLTNVYLEFPRDEPVMTLETDVNDGDRVKGTCNVTLGTKGKYHLGFIVSNNFTRCERMFSPEEAEQVGVNVTEQPQNYGIYGLSPDKRITVNLEFTVSQRLQGARLQCTCYADPSGADYNPTFTALSAPLNIMYRRRKPEVRYNQTGSRLEVMCRGAVGSEGVMSFLTILNRFADDNSTHPVIHLYKTSTPQDFKDTLPYTVNHFNVRFLEVYGSIFELTVFIELSKLPNRRVDVVCSTTFIPEEDAIAGLLVDWPFSDTKSIVVDFVLHFDETPGSTSGLTTYVLIVLFLTLLSWCYFPVPEKQKYKRKNSRQSVASINKQA